MEKKYNGGYSNLLYRDEETEQIHRSIDFSRHEDYDKMIDTLLMIGRNEEKIYQEKAMKTITVI